MQKIINVKIGDFIMKKYRFRIFIGSIILIISLIIIFNYNYYYHIKLDEVQLITVDNKEFTIEKDIEQIKYIVSMYNESKPYRNDYATTPMHEITIMLKNGQYINIGGSTQGFQTVIKNNKQYNISNNKLWNYFKSLD